MKPLCEVACRYDLARNRLVEVVNERVRVEKLWAAQPFGAFLYLAYQRGILADYRRRVRELSHYESVEKEHLPRARGIDAAVIAAPRRHDDESVERHLLGRADKAVLRIPFGRAVAVLCDVACKRLYPANVDLGGVARKEARGVDKFACNDPFGREGLSRCRCLRAVGANAWCLVRRAIALSQNGTWVERKPERVRAAVVVRLGVEVTDAGEKPCQKRAVQRVRAAVVAFDVEAEVLRKVRKLSHEIAPFAHLRIREVCLWREFPQLRLRKLLRLSVPPLPEFQRAEEV